MKSLKLPGSELLPSKPHHIAYWIYKNEGLRKFYVGYDAAIIRQVTYGTIRLGVFQSFVDYYKHHYNRSMNTIEKVILIYEI